MLKKGNVRSNQVLLFARNFLKNPRAVGSIIPSSPFLIRSMLAQVRWPEARVLVEYGPGTGSVTREILANMAPDATLISIEMNEEFVRNLTQRFPDPRLRVVRDSAANVRDVLRRYGFESADYILSSLPFANMPVSLRGQILWETSQAIGPSGALVLYQYSPRLESTLGPIFEHVDRDLVLRNFPPALCYRCSR
ncbi:MAG: methyltransferase [Acidobacteriales bacterium]|nr:methyltransferase [Terriglobales bacterium]